MKHCTWCRSKRSVSEHGLLEGTCLRCGRSNTRFDYLAEQYAPVAFAFLVVLFLGAVGWLILP